MHARQDRPCRNFLAISGDEAMILPEYLSGSMGKAKYFRLKISA
jgi:hypothetical protein